MKRKNTSRAPKPRIALQIHRALCSLALLAAISLAAGCNKPTEDECRKAVENVLKLTGTSNSDSETYKPKAIRSCRGSSTKESVRCVANAKSVEELNKCSGGVVDGYIKEEEAAEKKANEEFRKKHDKDAPKDESEGADNAAPKDESEGADNAAPKDESEGADNAAPKEN